MSSLVTAALSDHGRNLSARDRFALNLEIVSSVVKAYIKCNALSLIAAVAWDPTDRSPRWSANTVHFVVDTENIARKALARHESKAELEAAWETFIASEGEQVIFDTNSRRMVNILGGAFRHARMQPHLYFTSVRCYPNKPRREQCQ